MSSSIVINQQVSSSDLGRFASEAKIKDLKYVEVACEGQ